MRFTAHEIRNPTSIVSSGIDVLLGKLTGGLRGVAVSYDSLADTVNDIRSEQCIRSVFYNKILR